MNRHIANISRRIYVIKYLPLHHRLQHRQIIKDKYIWMKPIPIKLIKEALDENKHSLNTSSAY